MSEVAIHTSLRNAARAPMTRAELDALRTKAWIEQGLVVIAPAEIGDDWLRQGLVNLATKRFGKRMKR